MSLFKFCIYKCYQKETKQRSKEREVVVTHDKKLKWILDKLHIAPSANHKKQTGKYKY